MKKNNLYSVSTIEKDRQPGHSYPALPDTFEPDSGRT